MPMVCRNSDKNEGRRPGEWVAGIGQVWLAGSAGQKLVAAAGEMLTRLMRADARNPRAMIPPSVEGISTSTKFIHKIQEVNF